MLKPRRCAQSLNVSPRATPKPRRKKHLRAAGVSTVGIQDDLWFSVSRRYGTGLSKVAGAFVIVGQNGTDRGL